nr:MAG TPA: hypothetical protein [Caudoviricetes sp.]
MHGYKVVPQTVEVPAGSLIKVACVYADYTL